MARITVEDCVEVVKDRFELVVLAAERAKEITAGAPITVERDNDKNAIIALREIAEKKVDPEILRKNLVKRYLQSHNLIPADEEILDNEADHIAEEAMKELAAYEVADDINDIGEFDDLGGIHFEDEE